MYFPEEEEHEVHQVQDLYYGLEEGDLFTEYEIGLLRLVAMRLTNTTPTLAQNCSVADSILEYKRYRDEEDFRDMRMKLKRPMSVDEEAPENDEGVSPVKKSKVHNGESAEEEPNAFPECSDRSPEDATAIQNLFSEKAEPTKDI